MPQLNSADLDQLYQKANEADKDIFAEMRSNLSLVSGDHYNNNYSKYWERIRESEDLTKQTKLRLTKNHIKKIINNYEATVLSHSPGTRVLPNNPDELQDQKSAELNESVLSYLKKTMKLRAKTRLLAQHFFQFGEAIVKVFFDPDIGGVKTYEPLIDDQGNMVLDQNQQVVLDPNKPIMFGGLLVEPLYPFDCLKAPEAQTWEESPYIIHRKMISNDILKAMVPEQDREKVFGNSEITYHVFNQDTAKYETTKNKTLVREHYYRPSKEYPNGYFYLAVQQYVIFESELPFGIFPLRVAVCDSIATSARGRSPIKIMRPYQIEINRCASAMATTQITLGDDKLILNNGSKISNGGTLPGLRGVSVTGALGEIKVLPGRTGEQYLPYLNSQIEELYNVMNVAEENFSDKDGKLDPYAMLYHGIKNRKKFSHYTETFSEFIIDTTELLLDLAKKYLDPETIIPMVGRSEIVNIQEFINTDKNSFRITVEEVDTDAQTMLGKQLALNHTLQYIGNVLDKDQLGKIVRAMPFLNQEEMLDELTIDYDNAKNEILMIERGQLPRINKYDNHEYIVKRLSARMKKSDYQFLDPQIQQLFQTVIQAHQQIDVQQKQAIQRMEQGWIPTDGYMVTCDFYITKENGKTERVRLPYKAIAWLIDQLKAQGQTLDALKQQNQGALAEMAQMMSAGQAPANIPSNQQGPQAPQVEGVY